MQISAPLPHQGSYFPIYPHPFAEGEVLSFIYNDQQPRKGVVIMSGDNDWFLAAYGLYEEGQIWVNDQLPDNIELYDADPNEKIWGYRYLLEHIICDQPDFSPTIDPLIDYVVRCAERPDSYHNCNIFFESVEELPFGFFDDYFEQYKKHIAKQLSDTGLAFDATKTEYYCYLLAVICIAQHTCDFAERRKLLSDLRKKWYMLSWMYGMVIGRILGSKYKNFTSVVNQLDSKSRVGYAHLCISLITPNIDKICRYNNAEKKEKLQDAIRKIKLTAEREKQLDDLDELFAILFPHHFQRTMQEIHPAASIAELKSQYERSQSDLEQARNKIKETVALYETQLQDMVKQLTDLVQNAPDQDNSVSFSYIRQQLLLQDYRSAHDLSIQLNDLMTGYKGWSDFYLTLRDDILAMKPIQTTNVTVQPGGTYNNIHDCSNPTIQ